MRYVLDASIAVKWCVPETDSATARFYLDEFLAQRLFFLAPDILPAEVGNALWKSSMLRNLLSPELAQRGFHFFLALPIELRASADFAARAFELAQRFQCPFYDALYLTLAVEEKCELLTADTALLRRFGGKFPARGIGKP